MGFLDGFNSSGAIDKVADAIADSAGKVDGGIDKAVELVDAKTGRKHRDTMDKVARVAKKGVDKVEEHAHKTKATPETKAAG